MTHSQENDINIAVIQSQLYGFGIGSTKTWMSNHQVINGECAHELLLGRGTGNCGMRGSWCFQCVACG